MQLSLFDVNERPLLILQLLCFVFHSRRCWIMSIRMNVRARM
jgi:hypothetical protein